MLINDEVQKQVLPILAKTSVSPTADVQQRASSLLQLNPGQQVKAEIIANLPNNLYLARIAGEMYKLEIPLNVPPGEILEMTYLSADPRVTFQIMRPEGGGESVKLSSMGKWLSGIAKDAPEPAVEQGALLEDPGQSTALLAGRLKSAISHSGLFYESHLAQWAAGGLQLEEILKEPQGKLSRALGHAAPEEGQEQEGAGFADGRTLPFIKEQLLLLNSGVLTWKGEAWPGQGMQLAISARDEREGDPGIEATLSLDLTHLGGVEAKLRFGVEGFSVDFVCGKPGSSAHLKDAGGRLRSALGSLGLPLTRIAVKDDEASQ